MLAAMCRAFSPLRLLRLNLGLRPRLLCAEPSARERCLGDLPSTEYDLDNPIG